MNSLFFPCKFSVQEMSLHSYTAVTEKDEQCSKLVLLSGETLAFWMALYLVGSIAMFVTGPQQLNLSRGTFPLKQNKCFETLWRWCCPLPLPPAPHAGWEPLCLVPS